MALRQALESLTLGERLNDELYRSTTTTRAGRRSPPRFEPRRLDPWGRYRALIDSLIAHRPAGT